MKFRLPIIKISLIFCFSFALSVLHAQWTDNGTNIKTNDNVGIGSSTDNYSLFVRKNKDAWQGRFMNRAGVGADVYLAHGAGYGMFIKGRTADTKYTLQLNNINGATNIFRNNGTVGLGLLGNVGIGTINPTHKLTVEGDSKINGVLFANSVNVGGHSQFGQLTAFAVEVDEFYADEAYIDFLESESLTVTDLGGHLANQMLIVDGNGKVNKQIIPNALNSVTHGTGITGTFTNNSLTINAQTSSAIWNANKIRGVNITTAFPLNGQTMTYSAANGKWTYATPANGDVTQVNAGVGLTGGGSSGNLTINAQTGSALWNANKLQGRTLSSATPSTGQVLKYNGSSWAPANDLSGGGSTWTTTPSSINATFGGNAKVDFNNYGSDVALRLGRQDNSSEWWISHRGPTGAGLNQELEFVHKSATESYLNPLRVNRAGIVVRKLSVYNPGHDAGFDFNTYNPSNGTSSNPDINPIFKISPDNRIYDLLTVLKNGNVDLEAVPGGGTPGAKITLNGSGGIILEANNNQDISLKGAKDILIQNTNGSGNIKMTPSDFACIQGRLEIRGSSTNCAPDYVFAEDYQLRSIEELAAYIEKENHLPGVKSAEAFVNSGYDVVADSYSILEKVEELVLYTIDQENQISDLKEELKKQELQTAELKALVEKLLQK